MEMTQYRKWVPPCPGGPRQHAMPAAKRCSLSAHGYAHLPREQDSASFESLYRSHRDNVYRICLRMIRDPVQAEDLAQESFVRAFCKIHTFRGEAAVSTWLYRLTTNVVLGSFRKNDSKTVSLDEIAADVHLADPHRPDLLSRRILDRIDLKTAVDLLPDSCKMAFLLHDVEGYRHKEVASILGCSVGNSKSRLHRAHKRLRGMLGDYRQSGRILL
jgi:RNA polymerase sigma-70 factor, ECF subfamily